LDDFTEWAKKEVIPEFISWISDVGKRLSSCQHSFETSSATVVDKTDLWFGRRATVASLTHFNEKEISDIEKQFHKIRTRYPSLDKKTFTKVFSEWTSLSEELTEKVFEAFDRDRNGIVDTRDFVVGLSSCCRGIDEEKWHCT
jgi:Ca2+-binding EF-hand superfamily protein